MAGTTYPRAYVANRLNPAAISVYPSAACALSTSWKAVTCGNKRYGNGTGFSLSGGGVLCSFTGYVLVTANLYVTGATAGDGIQCGFYVTAVTGAAATTIGGVLGSPEGFAVAPVVFKATSGQVIKLYVANWSAARGTVPSANDATMLTVVRLT